MLHITYVDAAAAHAASEVRRAEFHARTGIDAGNIFAELQDRPHLARCLRSIADMLDQGRTTDAIVDALAAALAPTIYDNL